MRVNTWCRTVIVAGAATLCAYCSGGQDSLSDGQAASIIEARFNQIDLGLILGQVRFVEKGADATKGRDLASELPLYRAYAAKGVIAIDGERDLTKGFTGWNDWNERFGSGVTHVATVTLTEQGRTAGTVERRGEFEELRFRAATYTIENIVANDAVTLGADRYRVVQGTHTFEIPDDIRDAWEASRGWGSIRERRFRALLKWDPFENAWKVTEVDIGKRTEDFPTDYVDRALQKSKG